MSTKKIVFLFLIPVSLMLFLSCERDYNNPWDGKTSLAPEAWAPQNLAIEDLSITEKKLTWTYAGGDNFEGFKLDRKAGNADWQEAYQVLPKETRNWTDTEIVPDPSLTYSYRIYSFAGKSNSANQTLSTLAEFPSPSNLQITPISITTVTLSWDDNCNGEEGYKIDRKVNSGAWELIYASVGSNLTSYNDNSVNWQTNDYAYRIYAYSVQYNSSTIESAISWPDVTTSSASNIGSTSATSGGTISIQGNYSIIEKGVCYSTNPNPNLFGSHTMNGSGTNSFVSTITGLIPMTSYYVRAYATTDYGIVYGIQQNFTTNTPVLGDSYAGGIVFYLNGSGGGLVCAPGDQNTGAQWGCYGTTIGGTSTVVGSGSSNTAKIVDGCSQASIAARNCSDLVLNGYSDWFLPSQDELNLMYQNLKLAGIGSFAFAYYWSSSEISNNYAWGQTFGSGNYIKIAKNHEYYVRAVRAF